MATTLVYPDKRLSSVKSKSIYMVLGTHFLRHGNPEFYETRYTWS